MTVPGLLEKLWLRGAAVWLTAWLAHEDPVDHIRNRSVFVAVTGAIFYRYI